MEEIRIKRISAARPAEYGVECTVCRGGQWAEYGIKSSPMASAVALDHASSTEHRDNMNGIK